MRHSLLFETFSLDHLGASNFFNRRTDIILHPHYTGDLMLSNVKLYALACKFAHIALYPATCTTFTSILRGNEAFFTAAAGAVQESPACFSRLLLFCFVVVGEETLSDSEHVWTHSRCFPKCQWLGWVCDRSGCCVCVRVLFIKLLGIAFLHTSSHP